MSVFWQLLRSKVKRTDCSVSLPSQKEWVNELCRTVFLVNIYKNREWTKLDNYAKRQVLGISTLAASLKQLRSVQIFITLDCNLVLLGNVWTWSPVPRRSGPSSKTVYTAMEKSLRTPHAFVSIMHSSICLLYLLPPTLRVTGIYCRRSLCDPTQIDI